MISTIRELLPFIKCLPVFFIPPVLESQAYSNPHAWHQLLSLRAWHTFKCRLHTDRVIHTVPEARDTFGLEQRKERHGNIKLSASTNNCPALKFKSRSLTCNPLNTTPPRRHTAQRWLSWFMLGYSGSLVEGGVPPAAESIKGDYETSISDSGYQPPIHICSVNIFNWKACKMMDSFILPTSNQPIAKYLYSKFTKQIYTANMYSAIIAQA